MLWRLFHWLFGWEYVQFDYGFSKVTRRVQHDGDGKPYASVWGEMVYLHRHRYGKIAPLTCPGAKIGIPQEMLP